MDCDAGLPPPSRATTPGGLALSAKENPALLRRLGGELLLFAEWCQNRCAWRRRGYLAVVDELTRIIHASFAQAQIEVGERVGSHAAVRVLTYGADDPLLRRGSRGRRQYGPAGAHRRRAAGDPVDPRGAGGRAAAA